MATRKAGKVEDAKPATETQDPTPTQDKSVRGTSGERERAAKRAQAEDPKAQAKKPATEKTKHGANEAEERDVAPIDPAVVEVREDEEGTWIINDPTGTDTEPTTTMDKHGFIDPDNPPEPEDKSLDAAEPMLPPTEEGERPGDDTDATKVAREVSKATDKATSKK